MRVPGVPEVTALLRLYCGLESVRPACGRPSYCTLVRGLDAETAASWASLFYLGITARAVF